MIYLILGIAVVLRLININQSLWLDEAINIIYSQKLPFWKFVTQYPIGDFHPPLYFTLLWCWTHLFGSLEPTVRLLSVLFGIGTIYINYLLIKSLFNKKAALIAAFLLAINPLHIYYSQEARMYALETFTVSLSFYFLTKYLQGNKLLWWVYIGSLVLVLYSDYLPYLIILAQLIFVFIWFRKKIKSIFLAQIIASTTLVLWIPIFIQQISQGVHAASVLPGWSNVVGGTVMKELALTFVKFFIGRTNFDSKLLYAGVIVLCLVLSGVSFKNLIVKKLSWQKGMLALWFGVPLIGVSLISLIIPVFSYFRMLFLLPAFIGLLGLYLATLPKKKSLLLGSVVFGLCIISTVRYLTNPKFQREDWRGSVQALTKQPQGLIVFEDNNIPAPFQYYNKSLAAMPGLNGVPANSFSEIKNLEKKIGNQRRVYLYNYLVDINDSKRLLEKRLEQLGFKQINILNYQGVGFIYIYDKKSI